VGTVVLLAWLCRVLPLEGLPSGLQEACGILRLCNRQMFRVYRALSGRDLQSLKELHQQVWAPAPEAPVLPAVQDAKLIQTGTSGWLADLMLGAGMVLSAASPHAAASPRRVPQALRGFFVGRTARSGRKKQGCSTSLWGSPVWLRGSAHGLPGFPEGCGSARGFLFLRSLRVVFQVQLGHQLVADDGQHLFQLLHVLFGEALVPRWTTVLR
jgi:hypothetical protein